ncbi:DUF4376 domain-containing protein [Shewanella glacialipiscicola]|uniref:DUF4376 domain-containing protein n=1 Tax=Shewanella glacialipiscicola TaxID=614069 RepID=UPI003D791409
MIDLTYFYKKDKNGTVFFDKDNNHVLLETPEFKDISDVLLVTRLHALNQLMHPAIDYFIKLYSSKLQWEWFNRYQFWLNSEGNNPMPVRPELKTIEQYRAEILIDGISIDEYIFRTQRAAAVNSITVEVDGLVFDGDEQSQRRMLAAIHASEDANINSTIWRLADNTETAVTVTQIRQAHSLAIIKQGELWTRGTPNV